MLWSITGHMRLTLDNFHSLFNPRTMLLTEDGRGAYECYWLTFGSAFGLSCNVCSAPSLAYRTRVNTIHLLATSNAASDLYLFLCFKDFLTTKLGVVDHNDVDSYDQTWT